MSTTYRNRYQRTPTAIGPETLVIDTFEPESADMINLDTFVIVRGERIPVKGEYRKVNE